ncbi:probable beta-D-xylosidase 7 [Gossypium raimondii]|uniref:probable beta-D-xylosidase 7 n=1 Tax=Gossypium raimondii TaxID=29730 RepID=UPI00227D2181|nr:probable beta-D-xylosidase 7 [Gossypium raimondii]
MIVRYMLRINQNPMRHLSTRKMKLLNLSLLIHLCSLLLVSTQPTNQPPFSCDSTDPLTKSYKFCKTTLPINRRVEDLVSRLTLDEKISQLVNTAAAIPRLGIPGYEWWSEALHGVAFVANISQGIRFNGTIRSATSFPQVILTAASFDPYLWYRIGQAIGIEARGVYNAGQARGMTFWTPNINIFRDPRWGRGQETPGEDPLVTGKYAVSFVRGIQGDSFEGGKLGESLQVSACCKHFTAYDLDNWKGINRFVFDANVTLQDLADTYQPPFQSCIEKGKASGVMCAYNRINGVPNCADYNLLSKTARGQWGFNGYITSDCDAVSIIYDEQGYVKEPEDAVADVLTAGMDLDCGEYLKNYTGSAIEKKKVAVSDIDRALHNLFSIRMRLGLFNGNPAKQPFGNIGSDQVCSQEHLNLALEAARNGIVLLKNDNSLLPLAKTEITSLAVIGPNANSSETLVGNYAGPPCNPVTPLQGLQSYVKNINYHPGCSTVNCSSDLADEAMKIVKGTDQVVLVMGLDQTQEREAHDRVDLVLPGHQQKLVTRIASAANKPVILVLLCGGPVDITFAKNDQNIGSIIWAGYPGEAGGRALAEIIFGDHNPGGRLPITWYPQNLTKIPMTDMRMRPEPSSGYPGRTYRFYQGLKVFEFGYGLSYTNYSYEFLPLTKDKVYLNNQSSDKIALGYKSVSEMGTELCEKSKLPVTVRVQNNGEMDGKHAVLLFVRQAKTGNERPIKQLVGFNNVDLKAGEKAEIKLELSPCEHLSSAEGDGQMVVDEGSYFLSIGDKESEITVVFSEDTSDAATSKLMILPRILIFFYIYSFIHSFIPMHIVLK